jgi:hypothetical protein
VVFDPSGCSYAKTSELAVPSHQSGGAVGVGVAKRRSFFGQGSGCSGVASDGVIFVPIVVVIFIVFIVFNAFGIKLIIVITKPTHACGCIVTKQRYGFLKSRAGGTKHSATGTAMMFADKDRKIVAASKTYFCIPVQTPTYRHCC